VIENATIQDNAIVGPFARIRPGTIVGMGAKIGNFVEVKKSTIGDGSKVSHLSYIGDASIGAGVNIGAGVITCNYDGVNKHQTLIEDNAFIGSSSQLVAPIKVGENATIGAGSTITKDVAKAVLSLSRAKQTTLPNWQKPKKI
jgi:bifunctional UDP-N-acetylglucosamine pyrophosphorylase/glucosamine-1-phosphate N-acetyltransferase